MNDEVKAMVDERHRIARELDVPAARRVFPTMSIDAVLIMLHKVRYEHPRNPDELRHESRQWLEERGHTRIQGLPWPPKGVLEK